MFAVRANAADDRRDLLASLTRRFRAGLERIGFSVLPGETPIVPVMLYDAEKAQAMARALVRVAEAYFLPRTWPSSSVNEGRSVENSTLRPNSMAVEGL